MERNKNSELETPINILIKNKKSSELTIEDSPITMINEDNRLMNEMINHDEKINLNNYEEKNEATSKVVRYTNKNNYINNEKKLECPIKVFWDIAVEENGHLYLNTPNGQLHICNFDLKVEKIIIEDDGSNKSKKYKLKCILENRIEERTIILEPIDLNDSNWIKNKLGIKYYLGSDYNAYKYLDRYISESAKFVKEEIEYKQVGWRNINGKYVYLHGRGAIGCNDINIHGDRNYNIEIDNRYSNFEDILLLTKICRNDEKSIFMFVYLHLSVLKELFSLAGAEPKFVLWIYGLTGSMKTSVSKIFFNLFNRGKDMKISATFKDTQAALELKAFEHKDCSLLIDDYHPSSSYIEKKDMESKASNILRMYGDGISKGRSNKYMQKQKVYPPRGLCVITGEDLIGGESTIARYVGIEVNREEFDKTILSFHQENPLLVSTYMNYFIEWVSCKFEDIRSYIEINFSNIRNNFSNEFNHPRLGEVYSILNITVNIIFIYFECLNYSSEFLKKEEWLYKLANVIREHEKNNLNEDPAIMYLIALKELICSGQVKVNSIKDDNKNNYFIGYEDEEKYYLIPKIAFEKIKKFWKGLDKEFPVGETAVNKALEKINAIEVSKERNSGKETIRRTKKIKIGNKSIRVLVVYKSIYNKLDSI